MQVNDLFVKYGPQVDCWVLSYLKKQFDINGHTNLFCLELYEKIITTLCFVQ